MIECFSKSICEYYNLLNKNIAHFHKLDSEDIELKDDVLLGK